MTTNYFDTFIQVAEDCPASGAEEPPMNDDKPTVAAMQYAMLAEEPYRHTSDDVIFTVYARRSGIPEAEWPGAREAFFAKGQPCLRASPLGKRYGWGTHHDAEGRVALVPLGSEEYERFAADAALTQKRAMRSARGR